MQKLAGLTVLIAVIIFSSVAEAEWNGVEIQSTISADIELVPRVSLQGVVTHFWATPSRVSVLFGYFGVGVEVSDWYRVAVFVGAIINFPQEDVNAFNFSVWNNFSFLDGSITFFFESDMIFSSEGYDYYGLYALNFNQAWLSVGAHAEQVNLTAVVGPQIGFSHRCWHGEIQYHMGVGEENFGHAVRIVNVLSF